MGSQWASSGLLYEAHDTRSMEKAIEAWKVESGKWKVESGKWGDGDLVKYLA